MSSISCGIVGLPNVGKSTLFNALLKKRVALSANYPFATIEPNTGVVEVPDSRLIELAELVKNEEKMADRPPKVAAVVEFVDIAGLVKGASLGEGLGNQFLSHIREVDAIIHVLRDFEDTNIIRAGSENPSSDRVVIETELAISDLATVEKLLANQEKEAKYSKDPIEKQKLEILTTLKKELDSGSKLSDHDFSDDRLLAWYKKLPLLTLKPVLYVLNVSENEYAARLKRHSREGENPDSLFRGNDTSVILNEVKVIDSKVAQTRRDLSSHHSLIICAKLEEELVDLSEEDRKAYLQELGIAQTGLERLIRKSYELLGLISYLTAGPKEVRAWTITKGTKAPQAAAVIHTDFEKAFIRAEVVSFEDLTRSGSYAKAKESGKIRLEGKEYQVKDGDVIEFRVNV